MISQCWPRPTLRPGCLEARPSGSSSEITQIYSPVRPHLWALLALKPGDPELILGLQLPKLGLRGCTSSVWVSLLSCRRWAPGGSRQALFRGACWAAKEAEGEHLRSPWACPRIQVRPPLQLKLQDKEVGLCHFALCAGHQWCNLLGIFLLIVAVLWGSRDASPSQQ